jgi:hypothetical protein
MPSFKILTPDWSILHTSSTGKEKEKEKTLITTAINTESAQSRRAGTDHRLGESGETYCRSCQGKQQNKRQPPRAQTKFSLSLSLSLPDLRLHIPTFLSFPVVNFVCVILVDLCLDCSLLKPAECSISFP